MHFFGRTLQRANSSRKVKCLLAAAIAVLGWAPSVSAQTASDLLIPAAVSSPGRITMKGFNYVSYYNGGYVNADSLSAMIGTGSNSVALAFEYGIDVQNSAVYADAAYTDSMAVIAATILEAKSHGLSIMVRPMIDFLDPAKIGTYHVGDWRSFYNPTDPVAFFASYKTMIINVAQVAQANGATILCIGLELDQLTGPNYLGGLNRSTQHFILNGKDGVFGDVARISSRFYCGRENGTVGSLAAGGVAKGDWTGVWQAVIVDLSPGSTAWWDPSGSPASLAVGIDALGARGDIQRHCGASIHTIDGQVARPLAVDGEPRTQPEWRP